MKDLVIAIYKKNNYAGETTLQLVKVIVNEEIPEEYATSEYEHKLMRLVDYIAE